MTDKYTSPGFRPIHAETMQEAAEAFALREARKQYGSAGIVRLCRAACWAADNSMTEYEAFIGVTRGNETTGGNFRFSVRREEISPEASAAAAALGRKGGAKKSERKAAAAYRNSLLGGRPRAANQYRVDAGCTNGNTYEGTGIDILRFETLTQARAEASRWMRMLKSEEGPRGELHEVTIWRIDPDGQDEFVERRQAPCR